jgi:hypothetical protein
VRRARREPRRRASQLHLALEAHDCIGCDAIRAHELHDRRAFEQCVIGQVHGAHAALGELANDAALTESICDELGSPVTWVACIAPRVRPSCPSRRYRASRMRAVSKATRRDVM